MLVALHSFGASFALADQGAWSYVQIPNVVSGENWRPQASLASNNTLRRPEKSSDTNLGYIGIERKPSEPDVVVFTMEEKAGKIACPKNGCIFRVSFDGGPSIEFLAEEHFENNQGKPYRHETSVRLKNAPLFVKKVSNAKRMSVTFDSKLNGTATLNFSMSHPLRFPTNIKRLNS